jgi:hypothetical protein
VISWGFDGVVLHAGSDATIVSSLKNSYRRSRSSQMGFTRDTIDTWDSHRCGSKNKEKYLKNNNDFVS